MFLNENLQDYTNCVNRNCSIYNCDLQKNIVVRVPFNDKMICNSCVNRDILKLSRFAYVSFMSKDLLNDKIYKNIDWYTHCFPNTVFSVKDKAIYDENRRKTRDLLMLRQNNKFMNLMTRFNRADKLVRIKKVHSPDLECYDYSYTSIRNNKVIHFYYECTEGFSSVEDVYRQLELIMLILTKPRKLLPRPICNTIINNYMECEFVEIIPKCNYFNFLKFN